MKQHANVSIFVPHEGCPNQCSFCNQRSISGTQKVPDADEVRTICEKALRDVQGRFTDAEIAFFGGSFTAIDRDYMVSLLEAAAPFVGDGAFRGIRISTRPDAINPDVLAVLQRYHVRAIELGAQSMSEQVLLHNRRGHTPQDVAGASRLIAEEGFELGLQMMTGLYCSDDATDRMTARELAALQPQTMRIYPTLVMRGTELATLYGDGRYRPQTLEQAVSLCAELLDFFEKEDIRVIRVGLHAQDTLVSGMVAGPYHPAFRELCDGKRMQDGLRAVLVGRPHGRYSVYVSPKSVSKLCGHGARIVDELMEMGYNVKVKTKESLQGLMLEIEEV